MLLPKYYGTPNNLLAELQFLATEDTASYFYNLKKQPEFIAGEEPETLDTMAKAKAVLREKMLNEEMIDGLICEFGVNKGESFIQICDIFKNETVYGFDAFEGLPENGRWDGNITHRDAFKYDGKPPFDIPKNGTIVNGWFEKTLPQFRQRLNTKAKFLHIDCDVYSSTVTILKEFYYAITEGTLIVFDDYCNYPGWRNGEYKAWQEFVTLHTVKYEYVYVSGMAVGIKVLSIK